MPKFPAIALCAALVSAFLFTLFQNTLDLPSFDDYDTTLAFLRRFFFENKTWGEKAATLFSRHNEHRILISKSVASGYYAFFDQLHFAHLVWIQNLFLLAFFALMLAVMRRNNLLTPTNVLLTCCFLFSLAFWQVSFYYWGGIQHYTVFFFCFLSLYWLDQSARLRDLACIGALIAAILAVFSFGNGFLVLPAGAFLLFVQKKKKILIIWLAISAVLLLVTFLQMPAHAGPKAAFRIDWAARLLFTFLGSFVYINPQPAMQVPNIIACMAIGLAVLGTWLWLLRTGYAIRNPLLYAMLSLPILTGMIISISRFETKAAGGIAPRYMFFTATIPVLLVLIFSDLKILRKSGTKLITCMALAVWGVTFYSNLHELKRTNAELVQTVAQWKKDPRTPLVYYHEAGPYSEMMQWAVDNRVVDIEHVGRNGAAEK